MATDFQEQKLLHHKLIFYMLKLIFNFIPYNTVFAALVTFIIQAVICRVSIGPLQYSIYMTTYKSSHFVAGICLIVVLIGSVRRCGYLMLHVIVTSWTACVLGHITCMPPMMHIML